MQIVTANRLTDGRVVFCDADRGWTEALERAAIVAAEGARELLAAAEADVAARLIVGPYAVEVEVVDGRPVPKAMRERIRVSGPTAGSEAAARVALERASRGRV